MRSAPDLAFIIKKPQKNFQHSTAPLPFQIETQEKIPPGDFSTFVIWYASPAGLIFQNSPQCRSADAQAPCRHALIAVILFQNNTNDV